MKHFNKTAFTILIAGILIQLAALFGEHALELPFVLKIIAPSYYHANEAIKKLSQGHNLTRADEGFPEISGILLNYFREKYHVKKSNATQLGEVGLRVELVSFDSLENTLNGQPVMSMAMVSAIFFGKDLYAVTPSASLKVDGLYQFEILKNDVEELKNPNLLVFCIALFLIGSVLDVIAFFIESTEPTEPIPQSSSNGKGEQPEATKEKTQEQESP